MISSSRQLKDKVRNISDGNSNKATTLIRNFMMERFLERVSVSGLSENKDYEAYYRALYTCFR